MEENGHQLAGTIKLAAVADPDFEIRGGTGHPDSEIRDGGEGGQTLSLVQK